jgi:four helix bundle protein
MVMFQIPSYRDSLIWRKSMDLAIAVNHTVRKFPQREREQKGLYSQLLQSSVRVSLRIAESRAPLMDSEKDILLRARFHLSETEFLLDVSYHLGYIAESERGRLVENCQEIRELIHHEMNQVPNIR